MGLAVYTTPTFEPVDIELAKNYLRVDGNDDNDYIIQLIAAARNLVETTTRRTLVTTTYTLEMDDFPPGRDPIRLPKPPLVSVTHIKYLDTAGTEQTLTVTTDYVTDTNSEPGRVYPAYGESWPVTLGREDAVEIRYVAGWSTAALVPELAKTVILLICGSMYRNRELEITGAIVEELKFPIQSLWALKVAEAA